MIYTETEYKNARDRLQQSRQILQRQREKLEEVGLSEAVYEHIQLCKKIFPTDPLTPAVSLEAVRATEEHSFRFFDAQIWASAKLNRVPVVLSEDFSVGVTVEGVTFENPLAEEFDLSEL